jgi:hypothetical protein
MQKILHNINNSSRFALAQRDSRIARISSVARSIVPIAPPIRPNGPDLIRIVVITMIMSSAVTILFSTGAQYLTHLVETKHGTAGSKAPRGRSGREIRAGVRDQIIRIGEHPPFGHAWADEINIKQNSK